MSDEIESYLCQILQELRRIRVSQMGHDVDLAEMDRKIESQLKAAKAKAE